MLSSFFLEATNYTSKAAGGNWTTNGTWVGNSNPGTTVSSGDTVFVVSDVTFSDDLKMEGIVIISSTGSLKGFSKSITVGNGKNTGALYNAGTINADKIDVKGMDKVYVSGVPLLYNTNIIVTGKIHTGTNGDNGIGSSGKTYNSTTGVITVSKTLGSAEGELHADGEIENCGVINVETKFIAHGTTTSCCGAIYTPEIEFDDNKDRLGTLQCQNICSAQGSSTESTWDNIGGDSHSSLVDLADDDGSGNANGTNSGSDFSVDSNDTFSCGTSLSGNTWGGIGSGPLPIEMAHFSVKYVFGNTVINWTTSSELNNDFFTIERSENGYDWGFVAEVVGMGNSNEKVDYEIRDEIEFNGNMYYRLSQTDFDGKTKSFPVKMVSSNKLNSESNYVISPNPSSVEFKILGKVDNIVEYSLIDQSGRQFDIDAQNSNSEVIVNTSNLNSGIYILRISLESKVEYYRVIVK